MYLVHTVFLLLDHISLISEGYILSTYWLKASTYFEYLILLRASRAPGRPDCMQLDASESGTTSHSSSCNHYYSLAPLPFPRPFLAGGVAAGAGPSSSSASKAILDFSIHLHTEIQAQKINANVYDATEISWKWQSITFQRESEDVNQLTMWKLTCSCLATFEISTYRSYYYYRKNLLSK